MAQKNQLATARDQQTQEFMMKLGAIQDVLPEDRPLMAEKYANTIAREEELRTAVGGDILNPDYLKGVNRLMASIANDPEISGAMYNYAIDEQQRKVEQEWVLKYGTTPNAWDNPYTQQRAQYKNVRESGRLTPQGILTSGSLVDEAYEYAKTIVPAFTEGKIKLDETGQFFVREGGEILTATAIYDLLRDAEDAGHFDNLPGYQGLERKMNYFFGEDPEAASSAFKSGRDEAFANIASKLSYDKTETKILGSAGTDGGIKDNDDKETDPSKAWGFTEEVLGDSAGMLDGIEYETYRNNLIQDIEVQKNKLTDYVKSFGYDIKNIDNSQDSDFTINENGTYSLNLGIEIDGQMYSLNYNDDNNVFDTEWGQNPINASAITESIQLLNLHVKQIEYRDAFEEYARRDSQYTGEVDADQISSFRLSRMINYFEEVGKVTKDANLASYMYEAFNELWADELRGFADHELEEDHPFLKFFENTGDNIAAIIEYKIKGTVSNKSNKYDYSTILKKLKKFYKENPNFADDWELSTGQILENSFQKVFEGMEAAIEQYIEDNPTETTLIRNARIEGDKKAFNELKQSNEAFSRYLDIYGNDYGSATGGKVLYGTNLLTLNVDPSGKAWTNSLLDGVLSSIFQGSAILEDAQLGTQLNAEENEALKKLLQKKGDTDTKSINDFITLQVGLIPSLDESTGEVSPWQLYINLPDVDNPGNLRKYKVHGVTGLNNLLRENNVLGEDNFNYAILNQFLSSFRKNDNVRNNVTGGNLSSIGYLGNINTDDFRIVTRTSFPKKNPITGKMIPKDSYIYTYQNKNSPKYGLVIDSKNPLDILQAWYEDTITQ